MSEERSRDRAYAALAANLVEPEPTSSALILLKIHRQDSTPTANNTLHTILANPLAVSVLMGHRGKVSAASFSPDGNWVVTASEDKTARIWNAATGKLIAT